MFLKRYDLSRKAERIPVIYDRSSWLNQLVRVPLDHKVTCPSNPLLRAR